MADPVISVQGLRKSYDDFEAVTGHRSRGRAGRDLRLPRAERRRQDDHRRDPRGLPAAQRAARCSVLGVDPQTARTAAGGTGSASCSRSRGLGPGAHPARGGRAVRRLLRASAGRRRDGRPRRARRQGGRQDLEALRRPAAAARRRPRPDRRPRAALPRRADDGLRPVGSPPGLGRDRRPPRPRQDGLPDHALHGGGAGARRPRRDHLGGRIVATGSPDDLGGDRGAPHARSASGSRPASALRICRSRCRRARGSTRAPCR